MKKVLILVGALFFALLVAVITIPFFINVDNYRPQIMEMANQKLNGKLELGKLQLSLIGSVKVYAESIKLTVNGYSRPFLDTNKFHLEIPYTSLLAFHPQVIAVLTEPKLDIEKNAAGDMNLMKLMKTSALEVSPGTPARTVASTSNASAPGIPSFLAGASLGLKIEKGNIAYIDEQTKSRYQFQGLDLSVKDLGPQSTMRFQFNAPTKGATPQATFDGDITGSGQLTPVLANGAIRSASGEMEIDASKLAFDVEKGVFKKASGVPFAVKAIFTGTDKDLLIKNVEFKIHEYKIYSKGLFVMVPSTQAKFEITSENIALDKLHELVPMLAPYRLKGNMSLLSTLESDGVTHKLSGESKLSSGEFFLPGVLKAAVKMDANLGFTENSLNVMKADFSGPGSQLAAQGTIANFQAPQFALSVGGKSLNLDDLLVMPPPTEKKLGASLSLINVAYAAAPVAMVNPMASMAQNPILAKAVGTITGNLGKVTVRGAVMENFVVKAQLNAMLLKLTSASFRAFGGDVNSTGEFNLKSQGLLYKSNGKANKISAKEAFASYFPKYQNTLEGTVDADWNVNGALYPETMRMKLLKGTAKMQASEGTLKTVDFQETIGSAMAKIPFLKNAKAPKMQGGFKTLSATLAFNDGTINVDPMQMIGRNNGVDVKGRAHIQESLEHESFLDVYDPHGVLPKEISKGANGVAVALHFTGPVTAPKTDYEYTVKKLASGSGKELAKSALKKVFGGDSKDGKANPIQDLGDKLKKKIKFF